MKRAILLVAVILSGCGSDTSATIVAGNCDGVDISRPPDSIVTSGNESTYTWGSCVKVFIVGAAPDHNTALKVSSPTGNELNGFDIGQTKLSR